MTEQNETYHRDPARDEITLKELAIVIRNFVRQAIRNWWVFALLFVLIGGFMTYRALTTPSTYKARLTFMINEEEGGIGGVGGLLGQIGFGGRRGRFNLDKILELSTSRNIVARMAFTREKVEGEEDFIANHVIRTYEMDKAWEEHDTALAGFWFTSGASSTFDERERKAMLKVYRKLVGTENVEGLISNGYSEESSIMSLTAETTSEDLSIAIVNNLFERLSEFYIQKTIEKQKATYDIVSTKVDSIVNELRNAEIALATFRDKNRGNIIMNINRVRETQLQSDITKLNLVHGKALENLEIADFSLKNATPFIQEIDRPIGPLVPSQSSLLKSLVISALISVILGSLYLLGRNFMAQLSQD